MHRSYGTYENFKLGLNGLKSIVTKFTRSYGTAQRNSWCKKVVAPLHTYYGTYKNVKLATD